MQALALFTSGSTPRIRLRLALEASQTGTWDWRIPSNQRNGKPVRVALSVSPIRNSKGTIVGVSSIARDITERKFADLRPETKQREIEWRLDPLPMATCDPGLMKQVFANLLSNAVKHTRPRDRAVIEVGETIVGNERVIYVRDNGVGFNMKCVHKLFGVFERLHRSEEFEGTGIGLATVRRIIQRHGGRVWAEGEPDKGATFFLTLPRLEPTEALPSSPSPG